MKVFQIIANAQGARLFSNMGEAFGFGDELMAQTVRYFIPPITKTIEKRAQTPEGLISVLEFLGSRRYDRFLDDPRIFGHAQVAEEGQRILDYLFARKERMQKIIENRAKVLPIDPVTLEKLFPFIAVLAIAAIELRTRRPLGVILYRVLKGGADDRAIAKSVSCLGAVSQKAGNAAERAAQAAAVLLLRRFRAGRSERGTDVRALPIGLSDGASPLAMREPGLSFGLVRMSGSTSSPRGYAVEDTCPHPCQRMRAGLGAFSAPAALARPSGTPDPFATGADRTCRRQGAPANSGREAGVELSRHS